MVRVEASRAVGSVVSDARFCWMHPESDLAKSFDPVDFHTEDGVPVRVWKFRDTDEVGRSDVWWVDLYVELLPYTLLRADLPDLFDCMGIRYEPDGDSRSHTRVPAEFIYRPWAGGYTFRKEWGIRYFRAQEPATP